MYGKAIMDVYDAVMQEAASPEAIATAAAWLGGMCLLTCLGGHVDGWDSLLANGALLFLIIGIFYLEPSPSHLPVPKPWGKLIVEDGPSLVFTFSSAEYILFACDVVDDEGHFVQGVPVHRRVRIIGATSVLISFALYVAVGYGGARTFGSGVEDDILKNFALKGSKHELLLPRSWQPTPSRCCSHCRSSPRLSFSTSRSCLRTSLPRRPLRSPLISLIWLQVILGL